jgi:hypothetical protein
MNWIPISDRIRKNPNPRNETLTLDRVLGKEKDEEGNLPGPPDTAVMRKATTVRAVITAAMVGARTEARLGRGSGQLSKAARRWPALPWVSARTSEGLGTGVVLPSSPVTRWPRAPFVFASVAVGEERRKQAEKWARVQGTTAFAGFDPATLKANRPIAASG